MKSTTPASCAPGVPSLGMICEATASISLACAGVKNPNVPCAFVRAAWCACWPAARISGEREVSHATLMAPRDRLMKSRREDNACLPKLSGDLEETSSGFTERRFHSKPYHVL